MASDGAATGDGSEGGEGPLSDDGYYSDEAATLGDRLAAARQAAGLTQAGLAARLGVGSKVVSSWENDRSEPRANRLTMLAGLLGVSVAWLLTGGGEGVDPPGVAAPAPTAEAVLIDLPQPDLDAARRFYGDVLGRRLGRAGEGTQEVDLFGARLTLREVDTAAPVEGGARIGAALPWEAWEALIERVRSEGWGFVEEPTIQAVGAAEEHGVFVVADPGGHHVALAAYRDPTQILG